MREATCTIVSGWLRERPLSPFTANHFPSLNGLKQTKPTRPCVVHLFPKHSGAFSRRGAFAGPGTRQGPTIIVYRASQTKLVCHHRPIFHSCLPAHLPTLIFVLRVRELHHRPRPHSGSHSVPESASHGYACTTRRHLSRDHSHTRTGIDAAPRTRHRRDRTRQVPVHGKPASVTSAPPVSTVLDHHSRIADGASNDEISAQHGSYGNRHARECKGRRYDFRLPTST